MAARWRPSGPRSRSVPAVSPASTLSSPRLAVIASFALSRSAATSAAKASSRMSSARPPAFARPSWNPGRSRRPSRAAACWAIWEAWSEMRSSDLAARRRGRLPPRSIPAPRRLDPGLATERRIREEEGELLGDHPEEAVDVLVAGNHVGGERRIPLEQGVEGVAVHRGGDQVHAAEASFHGELLRVGEVLHDDDVAALFQDLRADDEPAEVPHRLAHGGDHGGIEAQLDHRGAAHVGPDELAEELLPGPALPDTQGEPRPARARTLLGTDLQGAAGALAHVDHVARGEPVAGRPGLRQGDHEGRAPRDLELPPLGPAASLARHGPSQDIRP